VAHWSPLIAYAKSSVNGLSLDELLSLAKSFIHEHFINAVTQLHETALTLLAKLFPRPCINYLARGFCTKLETDECTWSHDTPTESQAVS
jgi:hypothetical protein